VTPVYDVALRYYYFFYGVVAAVLALAATPLVGRLAWRLGAVDRPGGRRAHHGAVPRLGGVAIAAAVGLPLGFVLTRGVQDVVHDRLFAILVSASVVFAVGVVDDLRKLPVPAKLAAEVAAGALLWWMGVRIETLSNPFAGGTWHPGAWGLPITVLWVVVVTNAVNLIDGLDGLAAGTGVMIAGTLFVIAGDREPHLRVALVVLAGALAGFLRSNLPPASVFMGDSGSLLVGFLLASLAIVSYAKAAAMATVLLPAVVFGLPLLDMAYAVARRYARGVPLGAPDGEHIHHRLVALGLSQRRALVALYAVNAALMGVTLLFVARNARGDLLLALLVAAALVGGARLLGYADAQQLSREAVRGLFRLRRERYLSYLLRRLERAAPAAPDPAALAAALAAFAGDAGLERLRVLDAGGGERACFGGGAAAGGAVAVRAPVHGPGGERLEAVAEWGAGGAVPVRVDEAARVVAAAAELYLERLGELGAGASGAGAGREGGGQRASDA